MFDCNPEQMRGEVDKTSVTRDLQNQIEELKRTMETEREKFQEQLQQYKEEYPDVELHAHYTSIWA